MNFMNPNLLWLAVIIPLLIAYYIWTGHRGATLRVSSVGMGRTPRTLRYWLRHLPIMLRMAALMMIIIALARPIKEHGHSERSVEGIDIVLAMDISSSMMALDFEPNRLEAAKHIAARFAADRPDDRMAVVAFAGESYTQCPLSSNHAEVQTALTSLECGVIEDGTAIGNGLATALNRLRESNAKSKVVILLTDGENNRGEISPMMSAEIAKNMGVKVYTIGVGSQGMAKYPAQDIFGNTVYVNAEVTIDEELLRQIAATTSGEYFRAVDENTLASIYERINQMEKSEVQITSYSTIEELFFEWVLYAILLLLAELLVARIVLNRIP